MEKIFYVNKFAFPTSADAVKHVFKNYFGISNPKIIKNENGKPYLVGERLFFSVTHTGDTLLIAVADENVGIDAERLDRSVNYLPILKKFTPQERKEISSSTNFLRHWTIKESAVKWLGGSLANDLRRLQIVDGNVFYEEIPIAVHFTLLEIKTLTVAVCSERDFANAEIIFL